MIRIVLSIVLAAIVSATGNAPAAAQLFEYPGAYARSGGAIGFAPRQQAAPSQYVNSFQCIPSSCPAAAAGSLPSAITGPQRAIGAGMVVPAIQGLTPSPSRRVR